MSSKSMLLSLAPWVLFSVIVERGGADAAGLAAVLAGVLSLAVLLYKRRSGLKSIDLAGITTFTVLAVAAFAGNDAVRRDVVNYGRGVSTVILALVMLVSVVTLPFTEQYARDSVPRQYWTSPAFRAINQRLSLMWGLDLLLVAVSRMGYGYRAASGHGSTPVNLVANWLIPLVLIFAVLTYTKRVSAPDPVLAQKVDRR